MPQSLSPSAPQQTRIRLLRTRLGLSQASCARFSGLYRQQFSLIELGEKCGPKLRARIALALDYPESQLFDIRNPRKSAYPLFEDVSWIPKEAAAAL